MTVALFIILFILFLFIWLFFDYRFGRNDHLRFAKKMESPILKGEFEIFAHGKELFADYFHSLEQAQASIDIVFYIVRNDAFSHKFLSLLKTKAGEGVQVRLLLDQFGSLKFPKKLAADLRDAGVAFRYSSRVKFPFLFYSSQVRNHRKITVIDGKIGYLGGFNIGKEYIGFDPKLTPWRDYHLKITGEGVRFLQQVFFHDWQEDWQKKTHKEVSVIPPHDHNYAVETAAEWTFHSEGAVHFSDKRNHMVAHRLLATEANLLEDPYIQHIHSAKESIIIGTPYFIPSKSVFTSLLQALRRGVKLTVIVPATADHILVQEASYRYFRTLLREGAAVYQFNNGFYHAKTIVIDNAVYAIGTANFDKRSFFLNKEINCYFYDSRFQKRVMAIIQQDIHDSQRLSLEDLNKPNVLRSVKEGIAGAISYFL
ncbi:cardiolipin synthase [Neobacillus sp. SM06]|uniref:cardiolipin synthase n=1 Tax=Neobacillus sp. SM06 TaxID=3422492 RepID=UPI003D2C7586